MRLGGPNHRTNGKSPSGRVIVTRPRLVKRRQRGIFWPVRGYSRRASLNPDPAFPVVIPPVRTSSMSVGNRWPTGIRFRDTCGNASRDNWGATEDCRIGSGVTAIDRPRSCEQLDGPCKTKCIAARVHANDRRGRRDQRFDDLRSQSPSRSPRRAWQQLHSVLYE